MKISTLLGTMTIAALAGLAGPAHAQDLSGRWRGVLLRDGLQVPISVELDAAKKDIAGRLVVQDTSTPIQAIRLTATGVHFEAPGEGVFDGTIAGNEMAGSVSGRDGSFALAREQEPLFDPIGTFGP